MSTGANAGVRFVVELAAMAAFGYWGVWAGSSARQSVLSALAVVVAGVTVWGAFCSPRAAVPLPYAAKIGIQLVIFVLATVALVAAGQAAPATVFASVAVVNAALLEMRSSVRGAAVAAFAVQSRPRRKPTE